MRGYVKKTDRRRYEDRSFSVRAAHRDQADLAQARRGADPSDLAGDWPQPRRPQRRRTTRDLP